MVPNKYSPPSMGGFDHLNLAAFVPQTRALGPGLRAGVWVQGCVFSCPGCVAPEWIPQRTNHLVKPEELADRILAAPVDGITLSGGEPFLQADALAELVRLVRKARDINCIAFSGYTLTALQRTPKAKSLLEQLDLLVDGSYVASRNRGVGLRGSDNQRFHYLTDRLVDCGYPFETVTRQTELHFQGDDLLIVGIPAHGIQTALDQAIEAARLRSPHSAAQLPLGIRL